MFFIFLALSLLAQTTQNDWDRINNHTRNKNWIAAEVQIRQALRSDANNPNLNAVLCWVLREQGQLDEAWKTVNESIQRLGEHSVLRIEKGWCAFVLAWKKLEENNIEAAKIFTKAAVELLPQSSELWNLQGVILTRTQKFEEAARAYTEGLKLDSVHHWLKKNRLWNALEEVKFYIRQGNPRLAYQLTKRDLLDVSTDVFWLQWEALNGLLKVETNPVELAEFRENLTRHLVSNPADLKDFAWVAIELYRRTGSPASARPFLNRILAIRPETPWAFHIAGGVLGYFAVTQGDPSGRINTEALQYTRRARNLCDAAHPQISGPQGLLFPLRGRILVTTGWDDDTVTHSGIDKYSLDFVLVNELGQTDNGNPVRPEDVFSFGTPVYAGSDGEVTWTENDQPDQPLGQSGYFGNGVMIRMADGNVLNYNHLKRGSVTVKAGDRVRRGQIIGQLGNSGYSTYPHLHFSVYSPDNITIPYSFAPPAPSQPQKKMIFIVE